MFNTANHQGNANQNHNEVSLTLVRMSIIEKTGAENRDVENREQLCTVNGNVNWCNHNGKKYGGSSKN